MLQMPDNYDAQLVTAQRMKPDGTIGVYVGDTELTPQDLQNLEKWRQDGIAAKASQQQAAPSNYTPPSAPSMFSVGPTAPQAGLSAVAAPTRPMQPAQPVRMQQPGLSDVPAGRMPAMTGGPAMQTGSAIASKPTQQPASFNYWQQYSPQAANAAMNSAPMREAANARLSSARARRGWTQPRTNGV